MISYIKGELSEILPDVIVVEANGIGYNIYVPGSVLGELPSVGSEVKIYTYMNVKEDECSLFGFLTRDDLSMFKMLICVNGIGPKAALGALSNITADDLRFAVLADDVAAIKALPGIGPKTAQKIIIELKDKLKLDEVFESALSKNKKADNNSNVSNVMMIRNDAVEAAAEQDNSIIVMNDAVEALVSLGYSSKDALVAVKEVEDIENKDSETVLKEALKKLAKF